MTPLKYRMNYKKSNNIFGIDIALVVVVINGCMIIRRSRNSDVTRNFGTGAHYLDPKIEFFQISTKMGNFFLTGLVL